MKYVIYKNILGYCVTSKENYHARIRDARAIQKCYDFKSANSIIDYYCKYFKWNREDFIIAVE